MRWHNMTMEIMAVKASLYYGASPKLAKCKA
jgi:hypothetical protein